MPNKEIPPFEEWPFRVPNVKKAIEKLNAVVEELKSASDGPAALKAFKKRSRFMDALQDDITHVSVLFSLDTQNKKYAKAQTSPLSLPLLPPHHSPPFLRDTCQVHPLSNFLISLYLRD